MEGDLIILTYPLNTCSSGLNINPLPLIKPIIGSIKKAKKKKNITQISK